MEFKGFQASRYGSSVPLVMTFSGKEGVSTSEGFCTTLGYTTDLTTDPDTGTMTYDAAKPEILERMQKWNLVLER